LYVPGLFSAGTVNYKYITETSFQLTVNTGNYSLLSSQKGAKYVWLWFACNCVLERGCIVDKFAPLVVYF